MCQHRAKTVALTPWTGRRAEVPFSRPVPVMLLLSRGEGSHGLGQRIAARTPAGRPEGTLCREDQIPTRAVRVRVRASPGSLKDPSSKDGEAVRTPWSFLEAGAPRKGTSCCCYACYALKPLCWECRWVPGEGAPGGGQWRSNPLRSQGPGRAMTLWSCLRFLLSRRAFSFFGLMMASCTAMPCGSESQHSD